MKGFKPIETRYNGYRFRSRKEARFAVMFDALGLDWDYEPQGYQLNGYNYLPDFRLPDFFGAGSALWVEVKGTAPNLEEVKKATLLAKAKPDDVVVLSWENFDYKTAHQCITFWHDRDGVFHSRQGWRWLEDAEPGWRAARSARFEHGDKPIFGDWHPRIEWGALPY